MRRSLKRTLICLALFCFAISLGAQTAGPTFYYVVTTVDANGMESVFSNQVSVTFTQGKHITSLAWTAATVSTGGAAISGYNMYRSTASGGPYTKINTALISGVTFSDTFVPPNAPSGLTATTN